MTKLIDLSSQYGLMAVNGPGRKKLLQGQLTCDLDLVSPGSGCFGAHCSPQGRVISLFYLFDFNENYCLFMHKSMLPLALFTLKKYAPFYKVGLSIAETAMAIGCIGTENSEIKALYQNHGCQICPYLSRFVVLGERQDMQRANELMTAQGMFVPFLEWKRCDMYEGLPTVCPETSGKFLPHELKLQNLGAISFDKGCYTGQEIIARMHYRAQLKNGLFHATVQRLSPPQLGASLFLLQDKTKRESGALVDTCPAGEQAHHLLIMTSEANIKNDHLFLEDDGPPTYLAFNPNSLLF